MYVEGGRWLVAIRATGAVLDEYIGAFRQEEGAILLGLNFDALRVIVPLDYSGASALYHIGKVNVAEGEVTKAKYVLVATGTEKEAE